MINTLTELNNKLVRTTMKYLDGAEPYILRSITNKLSIEVITNDKYDYGVYMDEIETYCYASLENTIKVLDIIDLNTLKY
ncbi:Hypothetical protein DAL_151 [Psychrobacter phage D'Alembert]|nr:Hypothetical protein DAL_8 [Psychrobacter phage D'Alembert]CAH1193554.1 Hypothetical protein DAL_151 [Psychrobacter phage D'Alembert]